MVAHCKVNGMDEYSLAENTVGLHTPEASKEHISTFKVHGSKGWGAERAVNRGSQGYYWLYGTGRGWARAGFSGIAENMTGWS